MATKTLQTRFVLKNDTEALWISNNPVLMKGEIGIANDVNKIKIGDGTKTWTELSYVGLSPEEVNVLIGNASDNVYIAEATDEQTDTEAITATVGGNTLKKADMAIVIRTIGETEKKSYTSYVYNDKWEAMDGNYSADNVYIPDDIVMAGNYTQVGNLTKTSNAATGTFETAGLSVTEALQKIFTKTLQPSITANPAVTLTASNNKAYEVGETVTPTFSATLSAGSYTYGPATGITAQSWTVTNNTTTESFSTASGSFASVTVTDTTNYIITAKAQYNAGAVAKDNVGGTSNPEVKIAAGSASKTSAAITGYRKPFWGVLTTEKDISALTSDEVRTLGQSGTSVGNVPSNLTVPVGSKQVIFAVKAGTKSSLTATDSNALNAPVAFTKVASAVQVNDKAGSNPVAYDIWYCTYDKALTVAQSLKLTW